MDNKKQIHDFAVKWSDKFRDENIGYPELVEYHMADDCAALGFEMDSGNTFYEIYGKAVNDYEALERIIHDVTDIKLLGSAIYSRWRYFNHWAYTGEEILERKNRRWFIIALERMALLSGEIDLMFKGSSLSELAVDTDEIDDLYVHEENLNQDVINKITLYYHKMTKIQPVEKPKDTEWEVITWDYTEKLIIDRETKTLEHIQNIGVGCKVSRKYEIEGGIESLLDNFDAEDLFNNVKGNPDDVIDTPNEMKDYTIIIEYDKKPSKTIIGDYDKNGLPDDFAHFAENVFDFMRFYGLGEIFDPSVYGKIKRRKSEYIFCSVIFDDEYKSYYYLTDDDSIEVGDFVLVPAGKDNHEAIVEVVNIEYFSEENAPFPIDKTKRIIRKCIDEDFDFPEGE